MSEVQLNMRASSLPVAATFALVLTPLLYVRGWFRLRRCSPNRVPLRSLSAFITGFFLVWVAAASPLAQLDHLSLSLHMVKHLLLMTLAAPLILVGAPALPLLHGLSGRFIQSRWFLRNRTIRWIAFVLAHPLFCWTAATAVVIGWHLPVAFQLAMRSSWMHSVEDVCFLLAGLLFWRLAGRWLYTYSSRRCRVTFFLRSLRFVTAWSTPAICSRLDRSVCLLFKTRSARAH
jgi:putative membrane protein